MKKRIAVLFLAALMAVTLCPAAAAAPGSPLLFSDLPEGHWAYKYVAPLYEQGVVNGYPDGSFKPTKSVTWGECFKLILGAIGEEDIPEREPDQHWAYPYIAPAIANRLMYSFDESYLDEVPTRKDVARMTARALDLTDISGESPYNDCDDGYVVELFEKGIMDGFLGEDGTRSFLPDEPISRAQISAIVWRMMEIEVAEGMLRVSNYWVDLLDSVPLTSFFQEQFDRDENGRATYSGGYYAHGIDVSGHKGDIDWQAVAEDGIDFAIIRAGNRGWGSGVLLEDSKFDQNMQGAIAAGIPVGAYYFSNAITVEEALEETDAFLARLEPYREFITYPVVCDWEYLGGSESRAYGVDARIITDCINAFCTRVAEAGYTPMVYFNEYCGLIKMDLSKLTGYEFWFAEYTNAPSCIYNFQMWQYSSKGKVAGIKSDVDMNLCFVPYAGEGQPWEPGLGDPEPDVTDPFDPFGSGYTE